MTNEELLSIGQLARSARCSVKALRHYAELGLLKPARVDPSSGYRYYRRSQARDAITISMLRRLNLPLPTIAELLSGDAERVAQGLAAERARIAREIAERQHALSAVERLLGNAELMPYSVSIETRPALSLVAIELTVSSEAQEQATTEAIVRLQQWCHEHGLPLDPCVCQIQPGPKDELSLRVGVGVAGNAPALPQGAARVDLPPRAHATTRHVGSYHQLALAHHALFAWVHERGHRELGPVLELYENDPAQVTEAELCTRVMLPIDASP